MGGSSSLSRATRAVLVLAMTSPATAAATDTASEVRARIGAVTYRTYCANCHGAEGKGEGQVAQYLKVAPTDLTGLAEARGGEFPRDEVYKAIDGREFVRLHGSREMPIWGDAFIRPGPDPEARVQQKIDELVAFLRSIQE